PTFNSAFRFEERLRSLETSFSEYRQTNSFADAVPAIPGIVHQYMTQQMKEAVREAALVEAYEADKAILDTYGDSTILKRRQEDDDQEGPSAGSNQGRPPLPDRAWNTTLPAAQRDAQTWISDLARQTDVRSSFNEFLDTPMDFCNFIVHRLNVDILTPDLLAGP
nr:hypothetical protein [Tanacetum cinerariifolium]